VLTLEFDALATTDATEIAIPASLGPRSPTRVFGTGGANEDVTGTLGAIEMGVASEARLSVADLTIPAGRVDALVVSGEIAGEETAGVTIVLELVPRPGAVGSLEFTPAPPTDITQAEDPWPGMGLFVAYDTDENNEGSPLLNGSTKDNGTSIPSSLTFSGPLVRFPVRSAEEARGVWDVKPFYFNEAVPEYFWSSWEGVHTGLLHGTVTVVALGDGDGDEAIGVRDFSDLQVCFTGAVGPVDPPAYAAAPAPCGVYDFDDDGDVDGEDYLAFNAALSGPVP
jgi:hypothetical protein